MNTFTETELKVIKELIEQLQKKRDNECSLQEHLQRVLLEELPTQFMTQTEAEHFLNEVERGVNMFNTQLGDCSEEEKIALLKNAIIIIRILALDSDKRNEQVFNTIQEEVMAQNATVDELQQQFSSLASEHLSTDLDLLAQQIKQAGINYSSIEQLSSDTEWPLYMAVATLIAREKGLIYMPQMPDAAQMGTMCAAGCRIIHANAQLANGQITESAWKRIMKEIWDWLVAALVVAILGSLAFYVVGYIVIGAPIVFFGPSIMFLLACLGVLLLAALAVLEIVSSLWEGLKSLVKKIAAFFSPSEKGAEQQPVVTGTPQQEPTVPSDTRLFTEQPDAPTHSNLIIAASANQ